MAHHEIGSDGRGRSRGRRRLDLVLAGQVHVARRWTSVHDVAVTSRHVLVMLSDVQGYVVPKERIRAGDLDQFVREARNHVSAKDGR
ncbi:MAG TPA: YcxB family protein [Thermoanaerobaculia bacterium]|nr:YcxB family protein [Thermoanaerobaculia bacterium]